MKTDSELNRLIAERVMGYRFEPHTVMLGTDAILFDGYAPDGLHWKRDGVDEYLNYCTDPAAWGALFVWLAEQDRQPELFGYTRSQKGPDRYNAILYAQNNPQNSSIWPTSDSSADSPGRALVLATLAAYGVEVE